MSYASRSARDEIDQCADQIGDQDHEQPQKSLRTSILRRAVGNCPDPHHHAAEDNEDHDRFADAGRGSNVTVSSATRRWRWREHATMDRGVARRVALGRKNYPSSATSRPAPASPGCTRSSPRARRVASTRLPTSPTSSRACRVTRSAGSTNGCQARGRALAPRSKPDR
jgi:hypothetical protein